MEEHDAYSGDDAYSEDEAEWAASEEYRDEGTFGAFDPNAPHAGATFDMASDEHIVRVKKKHHHHHSGSGGGYQSATSVSGYSSSSSSSKHHRSSGSHGHHHAYKKKHTGRWIALSVIVVIIALVVIFAVVAMGSARTLKTQAATVMTNLNLIQESIYKGDYDKAATLAHQINSDAEELNKEMESPMWSVCELLPTVGSDVRNARELVSVLDDISGNALVPLADDLAASSSQALITESGGVNLAALSTLTEALAKVAPTMQTDTDKVNAIDSFNIEGLASTFSSAKEKLTTLNGLVQGATEMRAFLPAMLGANGTRTYLIVAQNTAELHSCGGFPGAIGTLTCTNGELDFSDMVSPNSTDSTIATAIDESQITDNERTIFTDVAMSESRDVCENPDFVRVASLWADAYEAGSGVQVDGVITATPAIIQRLLELMDTSVTTSDGTVLDGTNATYELQSHVYWKYDSAIAKRNGTLDDSKSDLLFTETARAVFDKLLGSVSAKSMGAFVTVFGEFAADRNIMVWMRDSDEEAKMQSMGVSGALSQSETNPVLGAYLSNEAWFANKLAWYLEFDVDVESLGTNASGAGEYNVTVTIRNHINSQEVTDAGSYIAGYYGIALMRAYFTAPKGGTISDLTATLTDDLSQAEYDALRTQYGSSVEDPVLPPETAKIDFTSGEYEGLQIEYGQFTAGPGKEEVIKFKVTTSPNATSELTVSQTPTLSKYRESSPSASAAVGCVSEGDPFDKENSNTASSN